MISIVTAYYNRRALFIRTLESLLLFGGPEFEFVVVDDGSREEERVEDLVERFPFLRVFRLDPAKKWYTNPCIPFNYAIRQAKGDLIILQNPECFHAGPILRHVEKHLRSGVYLAYSCYALNEAETQSLQGDAAQVQAQAASFTLHARQPVELGGEGWYNHSSIWPNAHHFCAAITRRDLEMLGGFDERYATGFAYDDVELVHRIRRSGMEVRHVDEPFVFHQNHYVPNRTDVPWDKFQRNEKLFRLITEPSPCVSINGGRWGDPSDIASRTASEAIDTLLLAAAVSEQRLDEGKRWKDRAGEQERRSMELDQRSRERERYAKDLERHLKASSGEAQALQKIMQDFQERAAKLENRLKVSSREVRVLRETVQGVLQLVRQLKKSPIARWAWRSRHKRELKRIQEGMKTAKASMANRTYEGAGEQYLQALKAAVPLMDEVTRKIWWSRSWARLWSNTYAPQVKAVEEWWEHRKK
ncbi:glycosyltransferase [Roseimicrobium sp. ORNL1]|uniref:glycosyltransferase n=1 Tax=Roseimicrobium sp. ORNL1 TaxID=2711231 RepID=UPI0013E19AF0|nr:glycosyltransferase [Roseimicrobium sp. ORNL1]QIF02112.1 glycosyltransferase [Roseimicrobium sp. ORNL1]